MQEFLTVTGKPISVGTGLRVPVVDYQRAKARAQQDGVTLNRLLCKLIAEGLDGGDREQETEATQ